MSNPSVAQACQHLRAGDVIAYPTEAVWGLGCDPHNEKAVHRVLTLKNREVEKGLILVAADQTQISELLKPLQPEQLRHLDETWPGPVTWLIPDPSQLIPDWVRGEHDTVAIRVSAHPLVQALCKEFGGPIVSTSANLAGQPEIRSRSTLQETFSTSIDYVVDGELGESDRPSEIRDLRTGNVLR